MVWLRMISWAIGRGLVSGAVVGTLLGAFIGFIYGALLGLFLGAIIGAIFGFFDSIVLIAITKLAYVPPNVVSRYPKLVYKAAIATNILPIFMFSFGTLANSHTLNQALNVFLISCIPAFVMGIITAYFTGLFLDQVDSIMGHAPSHLLAANSLSRIEN